MVVLELDKDLEIKGDKIKYSKLEKIILLDFFKKIFKESLNNEGFTEKEKEDFIESYIESFDKSKLINI